MILETKVPSDCVEDFVEEEPDLNQNVSDAEKPELDEDLAHSVEESEPKMMSEAEKEEFLQKIFPKVDKALENNK